MNLENTKQGRLFGQARKVPTELSESKVASIIENFPTIPPTSTPPSNNWTHLFNLNNLIMMSIALALVATLTIATTSTNVSQFNSTEFEQLSTEITNHEMPSLQYVTATSEETLQKDEPESKAIINNYNKRNTNVQKLAQSKQEVVSIAQVNKPLSVQKSNKPHPEKIIKKDEPSEKTSPQVTLVQKPTIDNQLAVPDLSNKQLRQLKRSMFKNLLEDEIIRYEGQFVRIELPGQKIIVNKKDIPNNLYAKYSDLTMIAGTGPNRRIEMTSKYIKVGDFGDDGFKGHGLGTFVDMDDLRKQMPAPEKIEIAVKKIEDESKGMYLFANKILQDSDIRPRGKTLFPINVKTDIMKMLHEELYTQLLMDKLIDTKEDYVFIQIAKHATAINGKKLDGPLLIKYENIIEAYKIKRGGRRAILLSSRTVSVGDYIEGDFTGTSLVLGN